MKPILEVRKIGKKYRIKHRLDGYLNLRERLMGVFKFDRVETEDFWALNDVSFDILQGESIGIIGRNGAGKSTLLKILSRITPPTTGHVVSRGRIASLLEVGTGFHPELTGRENIFFNGSLLGMKRKEIDVKFDEIVDFSGVAKFLDTPLKHYSSGMQLRLAFAVAAHLDPEILIIDEVLAVGDAEFQKKCLGKMEDVTKSGRTVLFVSHNLGAISSLCTKSILMESGKIREIAKTSHVISLYNQDFAQLNLVRFDHPIIKSAEARSSADGLVIDINYRTETTNPIYVGFVVSDQFGGKVFGTNPRIAEYQLPSEVAREGKARINITSPKLRDGNYKISLWAGDAYQDFFHQNDCLSINVAGMVNSKIMIEPSVIGSVVPEVSWDFL
ncbi:hypothetical protein WSM22_13430 [Cytophagales bacterium WSM2-2]|nr:hypothetical protein WSM22_13430 [Cytophagales bacterium WSM2-2]